MVRATHARVLIRVGGTLPSPWVEAQVTNLCTSADYIIDAYTNPDSISTTSNQAIELAVDVVLRMMRQADMLRQSSGASGLAGRTYGEIIIFTDEIKKRIAGLLNVSYYSVTTVDMV